MGWRGWAGAARRPLSQLWGHSQGRARGASVDPTRQSLRPGDPVPPHWPCGSPRTGVAGQLHRRQQSLWRSASSRLVLRPVRHGCYGSSGQGSSVSRVMRPQPLPAGRAPRQSPRQTTPRSGSAGGTGGRGHGVRMLLVTTFSERCAGGSSVCTQGRKRSSETRGLGRRG